MEEVEEPEDFHHRCLYHSRLSKYFSAFLSTQSLLCVIQFIRDIDNFRVLPEDDKPKRRELAHHICKKYFGLCYAVTNDQKIRRRGGTADSLKNGDQKSKEEKDGEGLGSECLLIGVVGESVLKDMDQRISEDYLPHWFWSDSWDKVYQWMTKEVFPKFQTSAFYADFLVSQDSQRLSSNDLNMENALSFTPRILDLAILEARNLYSKDRKELKAVGVKFHVWGFPKPSLSVDDINDSLRIEIYSKATSKIKSVCPLWNEFFSIPIPQGGMIPFLYLQVKSKESLFGSTSDYGNILIPLAERKKFNGWFKLNGDAEIHISVDKRM